MFASGYAYSTDYIAAVLRLPEYISIRKHNLQEIIQHLGEGKYQQHGSLSWQVAMENSTLNKDNMRVFPALDLFIIHELPGLLPLFVSEDTIIAYLNTSLGRNSMADTVGSCLELNRNHAEKILALLDNKNSLLYRGLSTHRYNLYSRAEPSTMRFIRSECNRAISERDQCHAKLK